jgi:ribosomal protein L37E
VEGCGATFTKDSNSKTMSDDPNKKIFGECESCGQETILVAIVGMCGPCTFGEAKTINGNW